MANDGLIPDYEALHEQAGQLFDGPLEQLFTQHAQKYTRVSGKLKDLLHQYKDKIAKEEQNSNRSLFLFESIETFNHLFEVIEQALKDEEVDDPEAWFEQVYQSLLDKFELEEKTEDAATPGPDEEEGPTPLKARLRRGWKALKNKLKRDRRPENHAANHFLARIHIEPLEKSQEQVDAYFSAAAALLTEIWKLSNYIHLKGDDMVKASQPGAERSGPVSLEIDFTEIGRLEDAMNESMQALLAHFQEEVKNHFEEFKQAGFKPGNHNHEHLRSFTRRHTRRVIHRTFKSANSQIKSWQRTLMLIADDWLLELEISRLRYYILLHSLDFSKYVRSRFRKPLEENLAIAENIVRELISLFDKAPELKDNALFDELKLTRIRVKRNFVLKVVPEVKKIILESNIPAHIDEFEQSTAAQFTQLSKSRSIKKKAIYNEPTDPGDVDKISPASLVSFQMMPEFMGNFPLLKQGFTRHLQKVQNRIEEIPEIIDYSLQSSLNYVEQKKDFKEAEKIGVDGVKRAENKINDLRQLDETFFNEEVTRLRAGIEKLAENLSEITDNESALQIKIRIAKARAIEKSKEVRKKLLNHLRNFLPEVRQLINRTMEFLRESSIRIRKQFALEDQKHFVSTDVSDYLADTEKAIDKLPFIYQRLFKPEALKTFELYTDRPEALEKIKTAYSRWKSGKFAPAVIIGEKGWGKTSLINRFLKLKLTTEEIVQYVPDPLMKIEDVYEDILSKTTLKTGQENEEAGMEKRKIFVLDGLERLFEARIHGFQVMTSLLQHISDSNSGIFWIVTCHQQSWEYLDKTLAISDYFGYHIKLSDFNNEALMKTIERRHNISGYRLMFLPETQKKTLISFKKQTDFGDQEELRTEYFNRMYRIVSGNLSQAFLFWMRSTAHVTEDGVYIEYISSDYFNFLGSMSDRKLMMLKFIILQNGLNLEKFAILMRLPEEKCRLYLDQLYDDGILVKNEEVYNINPIIYRQVIDQLYLLNILH